MCRKLKTNDSDTYSYRKGYKKVDYYWDRDTDFDAHWVNGIDTSKYKYDVEQDEEKDHDKRWDFGQKIKPDPHVPAGESFYYEWMREPDDYIKGSGKYGGYDWTGLNTAKKWKKLSTRRKNKLRKTIDKRCAMDESCIL